MPSVNVRSVPAKQSSTPLSIKSIGPSNALNAQKKCSSVWRPKMGQLKLYDVRGFFAVGGNLDQFIWARDMEEAARIYVEFLDGDLDLGPYLNILEVPIKPPAEAGVEERLVPHRVQTPGHEPTFIADVNEMPACPECGVRLAMDEETIDGVLQNRVVDEDDDGPIHLGTCMEHGAFRIQFQEEEE